MVCHIIAVAQGVKINNREPKMDDFILKFDKKKQTDEEIARNINMWMQALSG